jgi:DNA invertase Pin-like site-specific DNA recombinase
MTRIGYARVSTTDQNLDAQLDALKAAGCEKVFTDKVSGKLAKRPGMNKALEYLRPGDALVITKLDRLGRSLKHLLEISAMLRERGIDLVVTSQGIDTSTPAGRMYFSVLGAIAEFEREMISERTKEGLDAARARGRKGGRKPVMSPEKTAVARQMYDSKQHTMDAIAKVLGVSRASIYRALGEDATV